MPLGKSRTFPLKTKSGSEKDADRTNTSGYKTSRIVNTAKMFTIPSNSVSLDKNDCFFIAHSYHSPVLVNFLTMELAKTSKLKLIRELKSPTAAL